MVVLKHQNNEVRKLKIIKMILSIEFTFALFVFAGNFKSALSFIPVDLTLLLLLYTLVLSALKFKKDNRKINFKFIILWLMLLGLVTISMIYTPSGGVAIEKYMRFAVVSTWCFIGPFLIFKDKEGVSRFIYGVLSVALIMGVASLFNVNTQEIGFVDAFGSNYQALSRTTASGALALIAVYLYSKENSKHRLLSLMLSIFLLIPTLVSGGRLAVLTAAIIALGIFPLMFFELDIKNKSLKIYRRFYTYLILTAITVASVYITLKLELLNTFLYRLELMFNESGGGSSVEGRTDRFLIADYMISQSPYFGKGFGSFGMFYHGYDKTDYPHQIFLEFWAETGIITTLVFTTIFIISAIYCFRLWKHNKNDWIIVSLLSMFAFWWVGTIISSSITDGKILFAFMGVLFTTYYIYKDKYNTEVNKYEFTKGEA